VGIPNFPCLKYIFLIFLGDNFHDNRIALIKDDLHHPFLTDFLLQNDVGVENYFSLVKVIPYSRKNIDDEKCEALAKVVFNCSLLTTIELSNNNIGYKGCAALALAIPQCRSLDYGPIFEQHRSRGMHFSLRIYFKLSHYHKTKSPSKQYRNYGSGSALCNII